MLSCLYTIIIFSSSPDIPQAAVTVDEAETQVICRRYSLRRIPRITRGFESGRAHSAGQVSFPRCLCVWSYDKREADYDRIKASVSLLLLCLPHLKLPNILILSKFSTLPGTA